MVIGKWMLDIIHGQDREVVDEVLRWTWEMSIMFKKQKPNENTTTTKWSIFLLLSLSIIFAAAKKQASLKEGSVMISLKVFHSGICNEPIGRTDSTCNELNNLKVAGTISSQFEGFKQRRTEFNRNRKIELTLRTNYQTSTFTRASINRLHDVDQLVQKH